MPLELLLSEGTALPITRWGHPVLHRPSRPVTEFGPELWNLLCDMFASDVAALRIRGTAAIEVLFVTSGFAAGAACYPRLQIELEPGSELTLVERHLGAPDAPTLVCANVAIELGRGARLTHYRLQQCGAQTAFSDTLAAQADNANGPTLKAVRDQFDRAMGRKDGPFLPAGQLAQMRATEIDSPFGLIQ